MSLVELVRGHQKRGLMAIRSQRAWLAVTAAVALLIRLPLFFVRAEVEPGGDSIAYMLHADAISRLEFPGMVRTPGYPFFLWLVGLLPGRTEDAAVIVQHLIGVGLSVGLVALGWRLFSPVTGALAGALAASSPAYVAIEDVLLADFLFAAVAFAGAAVLALAAVSNRDDRRVFVLVGVLFALAAYVKPVGQALVLAAPVAFIVSARDLRRAALASAVVAGVMLATLAPWIARNVVAYGEFGLSNQLGVTLFNRAFEVERLPVPLDDPQGPLVRRLTKTAEADPDLRPSSYVRNELDQRGFTLGEALAIQRRLAAKAIRRAPGRYLRTSVRRARAAINDLGVRTWPDRIDVAPFRYLSSAALKVGARLNSLWFVLSANLLAALVLLFVPQPRRTATVTMIATGLLILTATVLTHGGMYRYSLQVAPEAWLAGSAGLVFVLGAALERVRHEYA